MSTLLGDLTSWIDSKKRIAADRVSTLLSDPATLATRAVSDVEQQYQPLIDAAMQGDTAGILNTGLLGPLQTVWHGSPHLFDKFDASKIGTGEGAQAYGHGLYLAENRNAAGQYRNIGADETRNLERHMAAELAKQKPDMEWVAKVRQRIAERKGAGIDKDVYGNLYKVDLPDEAISKMLDWDKPLSQQGFKAEDPTMTGEQLWNALSLGTDRKKTAEILSRQGIPGIKYLDAGSRSTGKGTYNYVVFPGNEDLLKILERQ